MHSEQESLEQNSVVENQPTQSDQDTSPSHDSDAGSESGCANGQPKAPKKERLSVEVLSQRMQEYFRSAKSEIDACLNSLAGDDDNDNGEASTDSYFDTQKEREAKATIEAASSFLAYNKNALLFVSAANKLINYQSPKLSQIHITKATFIRPVIRTRKKSSSMTEWLERAAFDQEKIARERVEEPNIPHSDIFPSMPPRNALPEPLRSEARTSAAQSPIQKNIDNIMADVEDIEYERAFSHNRTLKAHKQGREIDFNTGGSY